MLGLQRRIHGDDESLDSCGGHGGGGGDCRGDGGGHSGDVHGGRAGRAVGHWDLQTDYAEWVKTKTFHPGDKISA